MKKYIMTLIFVLSLTSICHASMKAFTEIRTKLKKGVDKSKFADLEEKFMHQDMKGEGFVIRVIKTDFGPNVYLLLAERKLKYSFAHDVEIEITPDSPEYEKALNLKEGQRVRFTAKLVNITNTSMYFGGNVELKVR